MTDPTPDDAPWIIDENPSTIHFANEGTRPDPTPSNEWVCERNLFADVCRKIHKPDDGWLCGLRGDLVQIAGPVPPAPSSDEVPVDPEEERVQLLGQEAADWNDSRPAYAAIAAGESVPVHSVADLLPAPRSDERHEFQSVHGHPDDDECTYTAGHPNWYCGLPEEAHPALMNPPPAAPSSDEQGSDDLDLFVPLRESPAARRFVAQPAPSSDTPSDDDLEVVGPVRWSQRYEASGRDKLDVAAMRTHAESRVLLGLNTMVVSPSEVLAMCAEIEADAAHIVALADGLPDGVYRSEDTFWMVRHWWDDLPDGWSRRSDADPSHEVFAVVPPAPASPPVGRRLDVTALPEWAALLSLTEDGRARAERASGGHTMTPLAAAVYALIAAADRGDRT